MILQALDIVILVVIAVSIQSTHYYSDLSQPPESYVDSWELRLWNLAALRTNYMTKVIGFILILGNY